MRIENEFEVSAPVDRVWSYLLDVERVAPCMPGAQLTEIVDDRTWKGKVNVKMGPVSLSFAGTVVMQQRDDVNHVVVLKAEGREQRGKGAATALATSRLVPVDGGTKVALETDLTITGAVAQYGRGMIADISQRMTKQFAGCLQSNIDTSEIEEAARAPSPEDAVDAAESGGAAPPPGRAPAQAKAISGIRLGLWALWRAVVRLLHRLSGRRS